MAPITLHIPATEPAAAHHMGQATQAAVAIDAARTAATYGSLADFRRVHGDPAGWCTAEFDDWFEQSDAALAKGVRP